MTCTHTVGLEDWAPEEGAYDAIWVQWVVGHLTDDDFVAFFQVSAFMHVVRCAVRCAVCCAMTPLMTPLICVVCGVRATATRFVLFPN